VLANGWLEKALERAPRSGEVLALLGEAWAARGDKKAAREHLQRALAAEGGDKAAAKKRLAELQ
jgi:hypothetical protein